MAYLTSIHPAWGSDRNRIHLAPQIQAVLVLRYNILFVLQVIPYIIIVSYTHTQIGIYIYIETLKH